MGIRIRVYVCMYYICPELTFVDYPFHSERGAYLCFNNDLGFYSVELLMTTHLPPLDFIVESYEFFEAVCGLQNIFDMISNSISLCIFYVDECASQTAIILESLHPA